MTDAPERIWAFLPDVFDNMSVWQDQPSPDGEAVEYVRADAVLALVAEAYEDAAEAGRRMWRSQVTPERIWEALYLRTSSNALAAREARDKRVRDEALREAAEIAGEAWTWPDSQCSAIPCQEAILALIEGDQTDE